MNRQDLRKAEQATDKATGARLRAARNALNWTQQQLGDAVGITFQQIQKYEHGTNRIGLSRLLSLTDALGISPLVILGAETHDAIAALEPVLTPQQRQLIGILGDLSPAVRGKIVALAEAMLVEADVSEAVKAFHNGPVIMGVERTAAE